MLGYLCWSESWVFPVSLACWVSLYLVWIWPKTNNDLKEMCSKAWEKRKNFASCEGREQFWLYVVFFSKWWTETKAKYLLLWNLLPHSTYSEITSKGMIKTWRRKNLNSNRLGNFSGRIVIVKLNILQRQRLSWYCLDPYSAYLCGLYLICNWLYRS